MDCRNTKIAMVKSMKMHHGLYHIVNFKLRFRSKEMYQLDANNFTMVLLS